MASSITYSLAILLLTIASISTVTSAWGDWFEDYNCPWHSKQRHKSPPPPPPKTRRFPPPPQPRTRPLPPPPPQPKTRQFPPPPPPRTRRFPPPLPPKTRRFPPPPPPKTRRFPPPPPPKTRRFPPPPPLSPLPPPPLPSLPPPPSPKPKPRRSPPPPPPPSTVLPPSPLPSPSLPPPPQPKTQYPPPPPSRKPLPPPPTPQSPRKIPVGGSENWHLGFDYNNWALKNGPFYLNDILVFKYDPPTGATVPHSVYLLSNMRSFTNCDIRRATKLANWTQGSGDGFEFVLKQQKTYYFACGEGNGFHCNNGGMKFSVTPILQA